MFAQFWLRQCRMVLRPHLFLPALTVYYREVPLLGFRLVWCWSGVSVAFALIARTIPAPVLVLALCSAADVAIFSSIPRFSR